MLIISRKLGQRIYIGEDVVITVTMIDEHRVGLGITAPADVIIDREEIRQRKQQENAKPE